MTPPGSTVSMRIRSWRPPMPSISGPRSTATSCFDVTPLFSVGAGCCALALQGPAMRNEPTSQPAKSDVRFLFIESPPFCQVPSPPSLPCGAVREDSLGSRLSLVSVGAQWELRVALARTDRRFRSYDPSVRAHVDRHFPGVTILQGAFRTRTGSSRSGRYGGAGSGKLLTLR